MKPFELCGLSLSMLKEKLTEMNEAPFRAQQILDWVYQRKACSFNEMTNLSKELRDRLQAQFSFPLLRLIQTQESDEVKKYLWELPDGHRIESVLIQSMNRRTVCVSSQVGCPGRCAFCASGKKGLIRSLSCAEIVEQVVQIDRELSQKGERVCHVVYMGMGEPLENFDAVVQSIELIAHFLTISMRRITLSTVGVVKGIYRLAEVDLSVNLALSLHAPNQQIRQMIIPYARKYPIDEVLTAIDYYFQKTKRDITFEYTLLASINDQPEHAYELANLLKNKQCTVNLIPYNPVSLSPFQRPDRWVIEQFRDILDKQGINATWRYTKGDDISAACGQLILNSI